MRILFLAGRELSYPRNDVLLRAFERLGTVDVIGNNQVQSPLIGTARIFIPSVLHLVRQNPYDLIFVGFFGHLLMLPLGILSHTPILFDPFVSVYDTLCFDRRIFRERSLLGRVSFWLDRTACRLATRVLLDTQLHANYFAETFKISANKLSVLPVGCNEDIFSPRQTSPSEYTRVIYYSSYQPLHGVDTVAQAAALLASEPRIRFRFIGDGQEFKRVTRLAETLRLENTVFVLRVSLADLPAEIAAADICLGGHFGNSDKAKRVIPGKIYQILAMARPLVASDSPANRQLLTDGENALLCPPMDPENLASAIMRLHLDRKLRESIARGGRDLYSKHCSESIITGRLEQIVGKTKLG